MPFKSRLRASSPTEDDKIDKRKSRRRSSVVALLKSFKWRRKSKDDGKKSGIPTVIPTKSTTTKSNDAPIPLAQLNSEKSRVKVSEGDEEKEEEEISLSRRASSPNKQKEVVQVLSKEDIHSLFSGAPQFSIAQGDGQHNATASFPWDFSLGVRDVSDSLPLEHPAYSPVTVRTHLSSPGNRNDRDTSFVGYKIGVVEVPNMLRALGKEPGTVGFEYFLQEAIADSLVNHADKSERGSPALDAISNHELLQSNPERLGMRQFELEHVSERLFELSDMYENFRESWATSKVNILTQQTPSELYAVLFGRLLTPPKFDATTEDPTGLKVQIEALTKALKVSDLWYDFSKVEWRIRIGQIIWSEGSQSDDEDDDLSGELTDRNVFLLQLVLSCELLLRLDAIASLSTQAVKEDLHLTAEEMKSFRDIESRKTRWDLVLARRFLDNVEAKCITTSRQMANTSPTPQRGFFSSSSPQFEATTRQYQVDVLFLPRKPSLRLSGLFHFAKTLGWPDADRFEVELKEALCANEDAFSIPSPSIYMTPLSTPRSIASNRSSSYFDSRPENARTITSLSLQLQPPSPTLSPFKNSPNDSAASSSRLAAPKALIGGWLTRSYLTGLIMPGEALCHFLISALLENDSAAIAALGDSANLYGGFVYKGRSYWSTSCIVGRVLACLKEAKESMGWISLPCIPAGFKDGWVDVKSTPVEVQGQPRVEATEAVESASSLLAGKELGDVRPADFALPLDAETPVSSMRFEGLRLELSNDHDFTEDSAPSFRASLHFSSSSLSAEVGLADINLDYLVTFVSAYPCTPPPADKFLSLNGGDDKATPIILSAHPLHVSQKYQVVSAQAILSKSFTFPYEDAESPTGVNVLVLDARGDTNFEILSRAWCSSRGEHALISRVDVTCLACSVREARALAIRVVIRLG